MGSPIFKSNVMLKNNDNIWQIDQKEKVDFSDGKAVETYLKQVIQDSVDLSSQSMELEEKILDWASEYHLSPKRANLLRGFNFEGIHNVLELGCGCGAMTRFLGEMGLHVDAIEGNLERAEITASRCRDLENVHVAQANFNALAFPQNAYDAVFLVGVLEYAHSFVSTDAKKRETPQSSLLRLLSLSMASLRENGLLFIAIENRMGLKYWLGASEEHYGRPYVGLYGYPKLDDIRTYDKREWAFLLHQAGIKAYQFLYPFPDYKLPETILNETFIRSDPFAYSCLYRTGSKDRGSDGVTDADVFMLWKGLHQSGYLEEFANSFLIVAAKETPMGAAALKKVVPFDFVHFSSSLRKPEYRTLTYKQKGAQTIVKKALVADASGQGGPQILINGQNLKDAPYFKGPLLSTIWLESITGPGKWGTFEALVRVYYHFLKSNTHAYDALDMIPPNIIVDEDGGYQVIDREWITSRHLSPEFLLFRALLWLAYHNRFELVRLCEDCNIETVKAFIVHGFSICSLSFADFEEQFIELETMMHADVIYREAPRIVAGILEWPLYRLGLTFAQHTFVPQLFWTENGGEFNEKDSLVSPTPLGTEPRMIVFDIPLQTGRVAKLRFDPSRGPGLFKMSRIELIISGVQASNIKKIWTVSSTQEIVKHASMKDVHYLKSPRGDLFVATSDDPSFIFDLDGAEDLPGTLAKGTKQVQCRVEMCFFPTADYLLPLKAMEKSLIIHEYEMQSKMNLIRIQAETLKQHSDDLEKNAARLKEKDATIGKLKQNIQTLQEMLDEQRNIVKEKDRFLRESQTGITAVSARAESLENQLYQLQHSKVWRLAEFSRYLFYQRLLNRIPLVQKSLLTLTREGGKVFMYKTYHYLKSKPFQKKSEQRDIMNGVKVPSLKEKKEIQHKIDLLPNKPLISIIVPVYDIDPKWLEKAVNSVREQLYPHWELCLVDDASPNRKLIRQMRKLAKKDSRIKTFFMEKNSGVSQASNKGLSMALGEYIAFLDHDDELLPQTLYEFVRVVNQHGADLVYSDEAIIGEDNSLIAPHFKPTYSPDLLLTHNYITHFLMIRRGLIEEVGGFSSEYDGAQDYDLILRVTEKASKIYHIPQLLYLWRSLSTSTSGNPNSKAYANDAGKKALESALMRRNIKGDVYITPTRHYYRVKRSLSKTPLISIIIPFRDRPELLRKCIASAIEKTAYANFEIIGVSNNCKEAKTFEMMKTLTKEDPRIRFYDLDIPFNYPKLNNYGVRMAKGEHIVMMNNDIEIISNDWLETLLEHSQRDEVGAVGAKLYYTNDRVQHAGVIIGIANFAGHSHRNAHRTDTGYFNKLMCIQNVSAVTGALLMVKRTLYDDVGGLDEHQFTVALNDVDFCLMLREQNYLNVFTPYCEAYHLESASRGYEDTDEKRTRFEVEIRNFQKKWHHILEKGDPFYNPNLTLEREDYTVRHP